MAARHHSIHLVRSISLSASAAPLLHPPLSLEVLDLFNRQSSWNTKGTGEVTLPSVSVHRQHRLDCGQSPVLRLPCVLVSVTGRLFMCARLIMQFRGTAPGKSASQEPSGSALCSSKSHNGLHQPRHRPLLQRLDLSGRAGPGFAGSLGHVQWSWYGSGLTDNRPIRSFAHSNSTGLAFWCLADMAMLKMLSCCANLDMADLPDLVPSMPPNVLDGPPALFVPTLTNQAAPKGKNLPRCASPGQRWQ